MKKNIALMALTGILTLSACTQGNGTVDKTAPSVTLTANPTSLAATGGQVTLSGTVSDDSGIASLVITRNDGGTACTPTIASDGTFSCTTSVGANATTSSVTYTYTAKATDKATAPNSNTATAQVQVAAATANPTTAVLTINLTGVSSAPLTIKDTATGAIVGGYNQTLTTSGTTIVLPRGKYQILGGATGNYLPSTTSTTADLSNGNATATISYVANTAMTGAFYFDKDGKKVYFAADPAKLNADVAAGKFRFTAWMDKSNGTGLAVSGTTITGAADSKQQTEYAPTNTQNIVGAYMAYNDGGVWRPVINSEVQMEILSQTGNVRFAAADDQNRSTMEPLDISANALSEKSWTNLATNPNNIPYPSSATYPTYNQTGVGSANTDGYTWAALNHDPAFATGTATEGGVVASARVRAIGYVNGLEIDKQFMNKNYVATANVEVVKEVVLLDRNQNDTFVRTFNDPTIPANPTGRDGVGVYNPGEEVGIRIRVINHGQVAANTIKLTDSLTSGNDATHAIGFSPALTAQATAQGITITNSGDDGFTANIATLAPGATKTITFIATGRADGTYCDTATIDSYVNGNGLLGAKYTDMTAGHLNVAGNPSAGLATNKDATCFAVKGVPGLSIVKTLVDTKGTATMDDDVTLPDGTMVARNENVRIRVIVRNTGTGPAEGVKVTDALTSGNAATQSITPVSTGGTLVGDDGFTWNIGTLAAGGVATYDFNARASADGTYCDTATVSSTNTTPTYPSDSACYKVATPFLDISKTNQPASGLNVGDTYTSTIIVKNTGSLTATNVQVKDIIGRLVDPNSGLYIQPYQQLAFASGRYVLGTIDPATGELRPYGTDKGVTLDGTVRPNQVVRTIGDLVEGTDTGITLPPNSYIAFNVVTTIPTGTKPGRYCDVATFTAAQNVLYSTNRAEACVTITAIAAIQPQLDDSIDPISKSAGESTLFTAVAYNEKQSTEELINNVLTFKTGMPEGTTTPGSFDISNISVWYDPTASDVGTGQIITDLVGATNITAQTTISPNPVTNGTFTITLPANFAVAPDAAIFVFFNGKPIATAAADPTDYNSTMIWTSKGAISGNVKTSQPTGETTTVKP